MSFNGAALQVSASIGVALYEAKRAGRNTGRWYGEMTVPPAALAVPAEDLAGP